MFLLRHIAEVDWFGNYVSCWYKERQVFGPERDRETCEHLMCESAHLYDTYLFHYFFMYSSSLHSYIQNSTSVCSGLNVTDKDTLFWESTLFAIILWQSFDISARCSSLKL